MEENIFTKSLNFTKHGPIVMCIKTILLELSIIVRYTTNVKLSDILQNSLEGLFCVRDRNNSLVFWGGWGESGTKIVYFF